jgi:hypothetical protein
MPAAAVRSLPERALEALRRAGNPFRDFFARNPDDEVCARYHVPELFERERGQLLAVVDLYRSAPATHSEVVPVLGNKGSGKTHLLHSIKHGPEGAWQLLVTPGTYQRDVDFLEYLLFQFIDTLLGGGRQKDARPLEFVGEQVVRGLLGKALDGLTAQERLDLFPASGLAKWARRFGLGASQAQERTQWLIDRLARPVALPFQPGGVRRACEEAGIDAETVCDLTIGFIDYTESHDTAGVMRRHILSGFARAVLLGDEAELAEFLTYGFAELDFQVRPSRQDLVLALFKTLMDVLRGLRIPVVAAFDQLEDLLLARRTDDVHRTAEAFFAGVVQAMHHLDGVCFLVFAERGLWNRFVPSLDGYIQDRLNNPIHLPEHGTLKALRLEAPPPELVRRIVEARLRPALEQSPDFSDLPAIFPFTPEQIERVARTEPTLRDMLQQFRYLFDHVVFGEDRRAQLTDPETERTVAVNRLPVAEVFAPPTATPLPPEVKSVVVVQAPSIGDIWDQEIRSARRKLEPEGALTGATRELLAGLGAFLQIGHEHGVKVSP